MQDRLRRGAGQNEYRNSLVFQLAVWQEIEKASCFSGGSRVVDSQLGIVDGGAAYIFHPHFHDHTLTYFITLHWSLRLGVRDNMQRHMLHLWHIHALYKPLVAHICITQSISGTYIPALYKAHLW